MPVLPLGLADILAQATQGPARPVAKVGFFGSPEEEAVAMALARAKAAASLEALKSAPDYEALKAREDATLRNAYRKLK